MKIRRFSVVLLAVMLSLGSAMRQAEAVARRLQAQEAPSHATIEMDADAKRDSKENSTGV